MNKQWVALCFVVVLAGCAPTLRYQVAKTYAPPATDAGKACLVRCTDELALCKDQCGKRHQECIKNVEPEARERHNQLLRKYEASLTAYRWELERYRLDLMLGRGYWDGWAWHPVFPPPIPPVAPKLEAEMARPTHERCDRDCGCQSGYDACFLGCGGIISNEPRCIANCPPAANQIDQFADLVPD